MASETLSVGCAHEFFMTLVRAGGTAADVVALTRDITLCREILEVIRGRATVELMKYVIDTTEPPRAPFGLQVIRNHEAGLVQWDRNRIRLYETSHRPATVGEFAAMAAEKRQPLTAKVLDFLLEHPEQVPEPLMRKTVLFPGTTYRVNPKDTRVAMRAYIFDHSAGDQGFVYSDSAYMPDMAIAYLTDL